MKLKNTKILMSDRKFQSNKDRNHSILIDKIYKIQLICVKIKENVQKEQFNKVKYKCD